MLAQAGREIDSDFELASLLIDSADKLLVDEGARQAYFEAARSIQSDFEMARVYKSALKRGPVSSPILAAILDASRDIESDFEEASLLVQIAKLQALDNTSRAPFFSALGTVDSTSITRGCGDARYRPTYAETRPLSSFPRERSDIRLVVLWVSSGSTDRSAVGRVLSRSIHRSSFERGRAQAVVKRPARPPERSSPSSAPTGRDSASSLAGAAGRSRRSSASRSARVRTSTL